MSSEERLRILNLLASGKIDPAEAATLLDALGDTAAPAAGGSASAAARAEAPRYLRVLVEGDEAGGASRVNVRVPMNLIRAGVRLAALLPPGVHDQINKALRENGLDLDVSKIKAGDLDELVEHLGELTVDVQGNRGEKVRVFCE
ncbi:MAG TPA: hypothetical protein VLU43_01850 [Anaeromyxobacteraceae bacterium]|nr:hypothetical protein [Anaeromyxobacteraceae bacterium]